MEREKINKILRERSDFEILSPEEFREKVEKNRDELESAEIIPPEFGSNDSGYILVKRQNWRPKITPDAESFNKLLSFFGTTSEERVVEYENLRNRLNKYFLVNNFPETDAEKAADDVLDEIALKVGENAEISNIKSYALRLAKFEIHKYLKFRKENVEFNVLPEYVYLSDEEESNADHLEKLRKALDTFTEEERNLILSYYGEENNFKDRRFLAERLGVSEASLRVRAFRVRKQLKKLLAIS